MLSGVLVLFTLTIVCSALQQYHDSSPLSKDFTPGENLIASSAYHHHIFRGLKRDLACGSTQLGACPNDPTTCCGVGGDCCGGGKCCPEGRTCQLNSQGETVCCTKGGNCGTTLPDNPCADKSAVPCVSYDFCCPKGSTCSIVGGKQLCGGSSLVSSTSTTALTHTSVVVSISTATATVVVVATSTSHSSDITTPPPKTTTTPTSSINAITTDEPFTITEYTTIISSFEISSGVYTTKNLIVHITRIPPSTSETNTPTTLTPTPHTHLTPNKHTKKDTKVIIIASASIGGTISLLVIAFLIFFCISRSRIEPEPEFIPAPVRQPTIPILPPPLGNQYWDPSVSKPLPAAPGFNSVYGVHSLTYDRQSMAEEEYYQLQDVGNTEKYRYPATTYEPPPPPQVRYSYVHGRARDGGWAY